MPSPAQVTLPSDREVRVTRQFNAPRSLVWEAHTKPALVQKWQLGPPGWDMPVCEMDVRVGGKYRWEWKNQADGKQFGFFGTFKEVNAPARIVHEEYYNPGDIGGAMMPLLPPGGISLPVRAMGSRPAEVSPRPSEQIRHRPPNRHFRNRMSHGDATHRKCAQPHESFPALQTGGGTPIWGSGIRARG